MGELQMSEKTEKDWGKVREEALNEAADEVFNEQFDAANGGSLEHPSYEELEDKLTLAEQEAISNRDKCMRAIAEADNIRRRAERDVTSAHRFAIEKFVDSLLPVVDSLEPALELSRRDESSMTEGLELTMKLFIDALAKHNVVQLNPVGEAFDPKYHEAMSILDAPGAEPNSVITVFQKGYVLNDRVIRPARVAVTKK